MTSGSTAALGDIAIAGLTADNLTGLVEKVTSGATKALGSITMDGYDASTSVEWLKKSLQVRQSLLGKSR